MPVGVEPSSTESSTLYEVDFAALSTSGYYVNGNANVIDGRSWNGENLGTALGGVRVVNGSGLRFELNVYGPGSGLFNATRTAMIMTARLSDLVPGLDLTRYSKITVSALTANLNQTASYRLFTCGVSRFGAGAITDYRYESASYYDTAAGNLFFGGRANYQGNQFDPVAWQTTSQGDDVQGVSVDTSLLTAYAFSQASSAGRFPTSGGARIRSQLAMLIHPGIVNQTPITKDTADVAVLLAATDSSGGAWTAVVKKLRILGA